MYLNCHTYFSFRYGTMSIDQLLGEAMRCDISTLVLTDINNTSACLEFARQCEIHNIKPIVGIDFRNGAKQQFIGIAQNNEGFLELNRFLSKHLMEKRPIPVKAPAFEHCYVIYPLSHYRQLTKPLRPNEYIGVHVSELNRLRVIGKSIPQDRLVVLQPVSFLQPDNFETHQLLRAIDNNLLLSKLTEEETGRSTDRMQPLPTLLEWFKEFPFIVHNTLRLLESCEIYFEFGTSKNKKRFTGSSAEDEQLLRQKAYEGFEYRYGVTASHAARQRLEKELRIIHDLDYSSYFLINWDIVRYAQSKGYFYVGRGSGANSMVAYCMRITDVNPIDLDLYFERFINYYRSSPPDFDIDFSWKDRDDITAYILNKYGEEHTALLATYSTFQERSSRRELAKVFGVPKSEIDGFVRQRLHQPHDDQIRRKIFHHAAQIHGFPSHLSIHAGGILISEKPINYYTACELPPKGFPITQFDMITAEDIGLYKFDILSQRGLGHIRDAITIVKENKGDDIDIHEVDKFKEDPKVKKLLREGRAIGCFYVESPAMRMLLSKLQCDDYRTLVAASSIIRPGVARSGMMREYIYRFHHPNDFEYIHPTMEETLQETYGVMVYQEDVIKVAHHFAGLSLAESDILRRGMSGKFRSRAEFKRIADTFFENCRQRGYEEHITKEVWRQIESFSGYSFSKAHSASYAVESFQSLYLKAHYPLEFMVAVINNFGGFYRTENYVHEARMNGANIHAPCANNSDRLTNIKGKDIYIGFIHVKDLEKQLVHQLLTEREINGPYRSFGDVADRVALSAEQALILIRAGAFRFTGKSKKELVWDAQLRLHKHAPIAEKQELFRVPHKDFKLPVLTELQHENSFDEFEAIGFPLCNPFDLTRELPDLPLLASELEQHNGQHVAILGYLVTIKNTRTIKGEGMQFATFVDREGFFFDTVHFPDTAAQHPFTGRGVYHIRGKVAEEFGFYSIETEHMEKLAYIEDPRYSEEAEEQTSGEPSGRLITRPPARPSNKSLRREKSLAPEFQRPQARTAMKRQAG